MKQSVDAALAEWFVSRVSRAEGLHSEVGAVARACSDLTLRGGKRLRPVLTAAAYESFGGRNDFERIGPALLSLELLQTYLLIHDDWMDGDDVRRGGPSVHAALAARFGSREAGAVSAILGGDLAAAYALEALLECNVPDAALVEGARELAAMQHDVVLGQTLDVRGVSRGSEAIERMHDLKTGAYTVRGPIRLGAALAGVDRKVRAAVDEFAGPIGIAFQLRDDLLGMFGDPATTGKLRGSDLRERKRTAVVADLWADPEWVPRLEAAPCLAPAELERLVNAIDGTGVRARVESRIAALTDGALAVLATLPVSSHGRELLVDATVLLTSREL